MIIERRSFVSGQLRSREINVTPEQLRRWQNGELIQRAMPHLSADDREFIMTGVTPEEWNEAVPDE